MPWRPLRGAPCNRAIRSTFFANPTHRIILDGLVSPTRCNVLELTAVIARSQRVPPSAGPLIKTPAKKTNAFSKGFGFLSSGGYHLAPPRRGPAASRHAEARNNTHLTPPPPLQL